MSCCARSWLLVFYLSTNIARCKQVTTNLYKMYILWMNLFKKKIRLFCAAPHELIIGPILTFLGLKWPLENGPWSCQEKIEVFKMLHCKKCSSFSDDVILRARQIEIFFWVPEKFWKPTVALPLFVDLFIQIVDTSAHRRGRTVSSIFCYSKD